MPLAFYQDSRYFKQMEVHIPNSAFLGNINGFLSTLKLDNPDFLKITANPKWISVHPLILCIIGILGKNIPADKITCELIAAPSGHYLKRMKLFEFMGINPVIWVISNKHDEFMAYILESSVIQVPVKIV